MPRKKINRILCSDCGGILNGSSKVYCIKCASLRRKSSDLLYQREKRKTLSGYKTDEYRKYCEKNPEKVKAHRILNYHIKLGKIKRSGCQVCGISINVCGHHDDYSKPLEVKWLCPQHHKEIHNNI